MPFVQESGGIVHEPMAGADLLAVRVKFNLKRVEFGHLLGLTGKSKNIYETIERYENGSRLISPTVERLALLLDWFYDQNGRAPELDRGGPL